MSFYKNLYLKLNLIHKNLISKKSYFSFSGVDLIIENIFRNQKKGFYVDVGCQHPIKNNNTYLLFKKGWFGLNIDLDKDNIDLFNAARPNDENVNIAISNKIGETDLYFYHKKSPINTISKKTSNFQKANVSEVKRIKTETLTNILSKSITKNQKINLLSVDVEGHELQVFEGLDFNTFGPDVIIVEYLDLNVRKLEIKNLSIDNIINSDVYKFLILKKYILVNCIYSDLIFIKKDFRD
jgi:FkbM family methyltransferase